MKAIQVLDAVVTVFGVGMGASTLLQARRIVKRRRSDDVSVAMLGVLIVGAVLWLAYGFAHNLTAVIATNATWLVGASLALAATLRYRRVPGGTEPSDAVGTTDSPSSRREGTVSESAVGPTSTKDP